MAAYVRAWRQTHPLTSEQRRKDTVRSIVSVYVKRGKLVRPDHCAWCNAKGKIEAHHEDYSKPLEVIWLCRPCHSRHHRLEKHKEDAALKEAA